MDQIKYNFDILNIDAMCYESFPCQHKITIKYHDTKEEKTVMMMSNTIANYYKHNNIIVPQHFVIYLNSNN